MAPRDQAVHRLRLVLCLVEEACAAPVRVAWDSGRDDEHRDRVGVRLRRSGRKVRYPWAARDETHARPARRASVTVGREAGTLLVTGLHMPDLRSSQKSIYGQGVRARDPKDVLDSVGLEGANDGFASGHLRRSCRPAVLFHLMKLRSIESVVYSRPS